MVLQDPQGASTRRYAASAKFADRALANKRAYAARHGYGFIVAPAVSTEDRPAPWSKLTALAAHLEEYDWLAYLDGDALVADPEVCLEGFLDDA